MTRIFDNMTTLSSPSSSVTPTFSLPWRTRTTAPTSPPETAPARSATTPPKPERTPPIYLPWRKANSPPKDGPPRARRNPSTGRPRVEFGPAALGRAGS